MVYLAGQMLVFVLVAMLVGAVLAWIFMIAPIRRGVAAQTSGGADTAGSGVAANPGRATEAVVIDTTVADLAVRLRRQEDEWGLERADLTARLATAEQQAAESERRVAAAEHQVAEAERRVVDIDRQLREVAVASPQPYGDVGSDDRGSLDAPGRRPATTVADLARETTRLRDALADAEGRAAKFSSRLAMVRTEAEDAQRQVAIMMTRLDRHQAEWAAERVRLLARLDDTEGRRAQSRGVPGRVAEPRTAESLSVTGQPVEYQRPLGSRPAEPPAAGNPPAVGDQSARGRLIPRGNRGGVSSSPVLPGDVLSGEVVSGEVVSGGVEAEADEFVPASRVSIGSLPPTATATASPYPRTSALDAVVLSAGAVRRPLPGSDVLAGFVTTLRGEPSVEAGTTKVARPGSATREVSARVELLRRSADNLKEIVGIGPLVETRLRNLGITSFRQLAVMGDADVDRLAGKLDGFGDRIVSDDWVGQARDLQARLYGGQG